MSAFLYGMILQWKLDMRNKGVVLTYYVVPLIFFIFMGSIFTSINPVAKLTLVQSMTVFSVSMGAFLGAPLPLLEIYGEEIKKSYKVGGIPLGTAVINNLISGIIHLFVVSLIILLIAPIIYDASIPNNLILYFAMLLVFILTCLLLGSILGIFLKSTNKLTMASQALFLPSIMLSGIMFPTDLLPDIFIKIGKLFPATWGYHNMTVNGYSHIIIFPPVLTIIMVSIIIVVGIKRLEKD